MKRLVLGALFPCFST